jgi:glycosyltransferase involved in cell wall biosynthesis
LHDCINSLQGQTHDNWEAIIVNDGSTDETREIASSLLNLETRIRYIEQPNSGACAARNTGFRMAKGSYIQLLDADDKLEPDKLRQHSDYLKNTRKLISYLVTQGILQLKTLTNWIMAYTHSAQIGHGFPPCGKNQDAQSKNY